MRRQAIDDGTWFNLDTAEHFEEGEETEWNGEALYRTKKGRWVLNRWSQWQGSSESWEEISAADAARWLAQNDHDPHPACASEYAALER